MDEPLNLVSDFIVVGGGTAGLVLARRLSEAGHSVHVLEAGRKVEPLPPGSPAMPFNQAGELNLSHAVSMQSFAVAVLRSGAINWGDASVSEYGHGKVSMPAGRVLGGSSQLNVGFWSRGDAVDYGLIAEMNNDPSWKFESLEKYFKKVEAFHPDPSRPFNSQTLGDQGPINIFPVSSLRQDANPVLANFTRRAFETAGFKYTGYGNDGNSLGFHEECFTSFPEKGGRQSAMEYLRGFEAATLCVFEGQTVASIMFDGKKAVGVKTAGGTIYRANKEVLLCAGALRSPTILQRSGIGDKVHLERCGVPVLHHLPGVGQNLWDHPGVMQKWRIQEDYAQSTFDKLVQDPSKMVEELVKYNRGEGGLLASFPADFAAWKNYAQVSPQALDLDDLQGSIAVSQPVRNYLESERAPHAQFFLVYIYPFAPDNYTGAFVSVFSNLTTPTSRGYVKITSDDPNAAPVCDPNWLNTAFDRAIMKEAMKTANEVIKKMVDDEGRPVTVEEADLENDPPTLGFDEESLERKLKFGMKSIYHYAGTCAMAPLESTNPLPVVDSECKVHGIQGLRVIDASVFPVPITGTTQAPVYALAEKLADVILRDYPLQQ